MERYPIHVSAHIEKTGGTSVLSLVKELHDPSKVFNYFPDTDTVARASSDMLSKTNSRTDQIKKSLRGSKYYFLINPILLQIRENLVKRYQVDEIPKDFQCVHGHFLADRFDKAIQNLPPNRVSKIIRTIVLRDPLARMISQYDLWVQSKGSALLRLKVKFDKNLTFEKYSMLPELQNYQTKAFGSKTIDDFDLVGVTEYLDIFGQSLKTILGSPRQMDVKHLNESPTKATRDSRKFTKEFLDKFREVHSKDYDNYYLALRRIE